MKDFAFQDILYKLNEVTSTQDEAKRLLKEGAGRCIIITATSQTKGRGRLERSWHSSDEGNIYLTVAFEECLAENMKEIMPLYTAFCLLKSIGQDAKYKWVNDVIVQNKKVAGILIEKTNGFFIVGIGVNVNSNPQNTAFPAGNLKEFGLSLSVQQIFETFKSNLALHPSYVINFLQQNFFTKDEVSVNQGQYLGTMHKINPDGSLALKLKDGSIKNVHFGDVSVL